jgi:DNA polymerase
VICTLGNFATKLLRGEPVGISRLHGQAEIVTIGQRAVRLYPLYHPAAALYTRSLLDTLRADVARLPALLAMEPPAQPEPARPPALQPAVPEPELLAPEPDAGSPASEPSRPDWAPDPDDEDRQLGLF